MDTGIIVAIITIFGLFVTFKLDKRKSKFLQRQEDKREHYKKLIVALFANDKEGIEKQSPYFVLVASTEAVDSFYDFIEFLEKNPGSTTDQFDIELTKCVNAIRHDYHESENYSGVKRMYRFSFK